MALKIFAKTELVTLDSIRSNLHTPQLSKLGQEKYSTFPVCHDICVTEQTGPPDCIASGLSKTEVRSLA